ncbi:hypothetical protein ADUPG1_007913 [Aduncisulcus paluster]|uniref:Uncharacterized protein n=1 Tax=Aduncisulcus paluster TaxID=2918883 RepID=A0ABQ5KQ20_9EUKA|nr:hypothetical protein ADUPG1_007913 [Aduncisulcus paluster]
MPFGERLPVHKSQSISPQRVLDGSPTVSLCVEGNTSDKRLIVPFRTIFRNSIFRNDDSSKTSPTAPSPMPRLPHYSVPIFMWMLLCLNVNHFRIVHCPPKVVADASSISSDREREMRHDECRVLKSSQYFRDCIDKSSLSNSKPVFSSSFCPQCSSFLHTPSSLLSPLFPFAPHFSHIRCPVVTCTFQCLSVDDMVLHVHRKHPWVWLGDGGAEEKMAEEELKLFLLRERRKALTRAKKDGKDEEDEKEEEEEEGKICGKRRTAIIGKWTSLNDELKVKWKEEEKKRREELRKKRDSLCIYLESLAEGKESDVPITQKKHEKGTQGKQRSLIMSPSVITSRRRQTTSTVNAPQKTSMRKSKKVKMDDWSRDRRRFVKFFESESASNKMVLYKGFLSHVEKNGWNRVESVSFEGFVAPSRTILTRFVAILVPLLKKMPNIVSLNFKGLGLCLSHLSSIHWESFQSLQTLDLSGNALGNRTSVRRNVFEILSRVNGLKVINLSNNLFSEDSIIYIRMILQQFKKLKELIISGNSFDSHDILQLYTLLKRGQIIRSEEE